LKLNSLPYLNGIQNRIQLFIFINHKIRKFQNSNFEEDAIFS